jgi:hypothetical protein
MAELFLTILLSQAGTVQITGKEISPKKSGDKKVLLSSERGFKTGWALQASWRLKNSDTTLWSNANK